jgi:hypothetical protein
MVGGVSHQEVMLTPVGGESFSLSMGAISKFDVNLIKLGANLISSARFKSAIALSLASPKIANGSQHNRETEVAKPQPDGGLQPPPGTTYRLS